MMTGRRLLPAAMVSLALVALAPALAPAAGDHPAGAAKKCKKGRQPVNGKCVAPFKGKPAEITVAISGSRARFRWSPLKCTEVPGLPKSLTRHAKVKNKTIKINSAVGKDHRVLFYGKLVSAKAIEGQVSITGRNGSGVLCFKPVALKK